MIKSTLWLLLALSLLFNVFFVVGYLRAQRVADAAEQESATLVGQELQLDQGQAREFASLRATMFEQRRVFQESLALTQREIMTEMSKGELDLDRLRALVEREMETQREIRMAALEHLSRFADQLTPEQRRMMLSRLAPRSGGRHHRRFAEMLSRFDEDGNGTLDADEQAKARAFHENRRRERDQHGSGREGLGNARDEERRARFNQQFDEDGDGELNEQERAARETWIRERRRGGP